MRFCNDDDVMMPMNADAAEEAAAAAVAPSRKLWQAAFLSVRQLCDYSACIETLRFPLNARWFASTGVSEVCRRGGCTEDELGHRACALRYTLDVLLLTHLLML